MKYDTTDTESMLTMRDRLPPQRYIFRKIGGKYEPSKSSKNPMITVNCELCLGPDGAEHVLVNGERKVIAGVETKPLYFTIIVLNKDGSVDIEKTKAGHKRYKSFLSALGFDKEAEAFDDENPFEIPDGFVFEALGFPKEEPRYSDPTPEELAKGQKVGKPITDAQGRNISIWTVNIGEIIGPSSVVIDRPF